MNRPLRAALYSRVSTEEQAEHGTSLADQQRRTEAYCDEHDWAVVARYSDEGVSGATVERPALKTLVASAGAGDLDVVVVTDPDRLSRDLVDGLVVERELDRAGVQVVYLVQPSMGTLERQLRGVIAEEERRKIRDRTSRGLRAVATEGSWPGGPPPYGYRISVDAGGGRRKLEIDPAESEILLWMIDLLVDQRRSTWDVAGELNARGIPTAAMSRKVANVGSPRWTHRRVRDLLVTAKAIAGTWAYKTSVGTINVEIPPIVTEERLAQLQHRLSETSTGKGATLRKNEYLLAGRLTSTCGANMHGMARPGAGTRVYLCSKSTADQGDERCSCKRVSATAVELAVWRAVHDMLTEPGRLLSLVGLAAVDDGPDNLLDLRALDRRIRRIEDAMGAQIADLLSQGLDSAAVGRAAQQLELDLSKLRQQREQVVSWKASRLDRSSRADRVRRLADSAQAVLANPTDAVRKATLAVLDVRATIVGSQICPQCEGRGLLRATASGAGPDGRGKTGSVCPTCKRFRSIPLVAVEGLLPDIDALPETAHTESSGVGTPFTIHLTA